MQFYKAYLKLLILHNVKSHLLYLIGYLTIIVLFNCQIALGENIDSLNSSNISFYHIQKLNNQLVPNICNVQYSKLELFIELEDIFETDSKDSERNENTTKEYSISHNNIFKLWSILFSANLKSKNANFLASYERRPLIPLYIFYLSKKIFTL